MQCRMLCTGGFGVEVLVGLQLSSMLWGFSMGKENLGLKSSLCLRRWNDQCAVSMATTGIEFPALNILILGPPRLMERRLCVSNQSVFQTVFHTPEGPPHHGTPAKASTACRDSCTEGKCGLGLGLGVLVHTTHCGRWANWHIRLQIKWDQTSVSECRRWIKGGGQVSRFNITLGDPNPLPCVTLSTSFMSFMLLELHGYGNDCM